MGKQAMYDESVGNKDGFSGQFQEQRARELKHAERKTCNEKHDVRDKVISGDPFTPGCKKMNDKIIASSEKPKVSQDSQLHSDTTVPSANDVKGQSYEKEFTTGTRQNIVKDKSISEQKRRKAFNS